MITEFIHKFVPGKSPATILALHGTGGDENDLLPVVRALAPGAAVLSPRGRAVQNGAIRFFNEGEIRSRAADLAAWIEAAVQQYSLDAGRVYAIGYSNGASIAAALMLLHPGAIAGGYLLRPSVVVRPEVIPNLNGAPVLIGSGEQDTLALPARAEELAQLLTDAGARVDLAVQNAGHDLTPQDFGLGKQWFATLLAASA